VGRSQKRSAIRQLDSELRARIQKIVLAFCVVIFIVEIGMGAYLYYSSIMRQSLYDYAIFRIILPTVVNILIYSVVHIVNNSNKLSDAIRNRVCSTALIALLGEASICHSYYIQLWTLTLFGLMFAGVFHDAKFQKIQAGICYLFILIAGVSHIIDYPDELAYSIQCIVVSEVIAVGVTFLAQLLETASAQRYLLNIKAYEGIEKYKTSYEYDALTGVYSRGYLDEVTKDPFSWSDPDEEIGIAMIDIDDFKKVNDTYGHDNGDVVLRKLGKLISYFNDNGNICGRYGGEEFVVVFLNSKKQKDIDELNRIREFFQESKFDFTDKPITISIGYHACVFGSNFEESLKVADEALYESKRTGKNKITVKD